MPDLRLRIDACKKFDAFIRPSKKPLIIINDGLLFDLYSSIEKNAGKIMTAANESLLKNSPSIDMPIAETIDSIYDLALGFALEHEMQHLLCGHIDFDADSSLEARNELLFNELTLTMSGTTSDKTRKDPLRSYFIEIEADNSALDWMITRNVFGCITRQMKLVRGVLEKNSDQRTIAELDGTESLISYRLLLISVWIVVSLLEANRKAETGLLLKEEHPLPAARLMSAITTLMLWYARIDSLRFDDCGKMLVTLSSSQARLMRNFLFYILKPVAINLAEFPNAETASVLSFPIGNSRKDTDIVELMEDLIALIGKQPPKTSAGRQLEKLESLRQEIRAALEPYRYLEEMLDMTDTIELEISVTDTSSIEDVEDSVRKHLELMSDVGIKSCERLPVKGLCAGEVVILFVLAVSSRLTANEIQRRIDEFRKKRNDIKKVTAEKIKE